MSEKLGEACGSLAKWLGKLQNGEGILGGIKTIAGKIVEAIKAVTKGIADTIYKQHQINGKKVALRGFCHSLRRLGYSH